MTDIVTETDTDRTGSVTVDCTDPGTENSWESARVSRTGETCL